MDGAAEGTSLPGFALYCYQVFALTGALDCTHFWDFPIIQGFWKTSQRRIWKCPCVDCPLLVRVPAGRHRLIVHCLVLPRVPVLECKISLFHIFSSSLFLDLFIPFRVTGGELLERHRFGATGNWSRSARNSALCWGS